MFSGLTLITPPPAEPVSVAEAKLHSRIFTDVDDSLIPGYISAARLKCEAITWRAFLTQQWKLSLQNFPGRPLGIYRESVSRDEYYAWSFIKIPLPPLVSIDAFVYFDTQNNQYSMVQGYSNQVGNYFVDTNWEPGRACLPFAGIWPTTILLPSSPIQITYTAGWPYLSGTATLGANGILTLASPPVGSLFDPRLTGSWITITSPAGVPTVFDVQSYLSPTQIQLSPPPSSITATLPWAGAPWSGNCVPMTIRQAILFLAAHLYQEREPIDIGRGLVAIEIPGTIDSMLSPHKNYEYTNEGSNA